MISRSLPDMNAGKMKLKTTWCYSQTRWAENQRKYMARIREDPERYANFLARNREKMKRFNDRRTPETRNLNNLRKREYRRQKRAEMTPEEYLRFRELRTQQAREWRAEMTPEEYLRFRELRTQQAREWRAKMTPEERLRINELRRQKHRAKKKMEDDMKKSEKSAAKTTTQPKESRLEDGDGQGTAHQSDTHGMSDWSPEEKGQLLRAMASQCLVKDTVSFAVGANKLDWGTMGLEGRSPRQCRAAWDAMLAKVCKHRTLLEVLKDAESHLLRPETLKIQGTIKHPDQPKKPLTAYFQFVKKRRDKVKAKHPELTHMELNQLMAQRWKDLDPAKRSKYVQRYKEQWSEFQEENTKFLEEHPELNDKPTKPKRPSPLGLFSQAKLQKVSNKHPQLDKSGLQKKLRKKYKKLSADKRKTWVQRAVDAGAQYEREVSHYQTHHPGFVPPLKKVILTREEQSLIGDEDRQARGSATRKKRVFPGAPDKPPRSAFLLYVKKKMGGMEGVSMGDRMKALGLRWRELGTKQQKYGKKLSKLQKRYSQELDLFRQSLAEDDLDEFEKSLLPKKKSRGKEDKTEKKGWD